MSRRVRAQDPDHPCKTLAPQHSIFVPARASDRRYRSAKHVKKINNSVPSTGRLPRRDCNDLLDNCILLKANKLIPLTEDSTLSSYTPVITSMCPVLSSHRLKQHVGKICEALRGPLSPTRQTLYLALLPFRIVAIIMLWRRFVQISMGTSPHIVVKIFERCEHLLFSKKLRRFKRYTRVVGVATAIRVAGMAGLAFPQGDCLPLVEVCRVE